MPRELQFFGELSASSNMREPSGNFALVALLYPSMVLGEDLKIDAPVSPRLLYEAQHDLQSLLMAYDPKLKRIEVSVTAATEASPPAPFSVATGFSAGVDTFTTLMLFTAGNVPDTRRLTSLTTFDVGAMGHSHQSSELFEKYSQRVRDFSETNGFAWQTARSNLDDFYVAVNANFEQTHTLRNVAAAFVFEDIYSCYLYSSAYPYQTIGTNNKTIGAIDPILLSLLSTETLDFKSAGAGLSRFQKEQLISSNRHAMSMLDVCVAQPAIRMKSAKINCSRCWKCCRTMLNLDLLGQLAKFANVFDLKYYYSNRDSIILTVLDRAAHGNTIEQDLIALMRERNFDFRVSKSALLKHLPSRVRQRLAGVPGLKKLYRTISGRR